MFESLRPSEFRTEPSVGDASVGAPWPLEHRWLVSSPAVPVAPARSGLGRAGLVPAASAAVLAHGAALTEIERLGAGGVELEAVSVEMLPRSDLAPGRANERIDEVPPSASGVVATVPASAAPAVDERASEAAAASMPPILAVGAPARITVDLSLAPTKSAGPSDSDRTAALNETIAPAPASAAEKHERRKTATLRPAAQADPIVDGAPGSAGGAPLTTASVAAGTSAPADTVAAGAAGRPDNGAVPAWNVSRSTRPQLPVAWKRTRRRASPSCSPHCSC